MKHFPDKVSIYTADFFSLFYPTTNNSLLVPSIIAKSHRGAISQEIISRLVIVRIFGDVPQVSARSERKRGYGAGDGSGGCRRRWWNRWKEGLKERSKGCERGRRAVECWRQLPRCCRINFGGPQTQTVSVDSIERFYRLPVPSLRLLSRLSRTCRSIRDVSLEREDQFSAAAAAFVLPSLLSRLSFRFVLTATLSPVACRFTSTNKQFCNLSTFYYH